MKRSLIMNGVFALMIATISSCSVQKQNTMSKTELPDRKEVLDVSRRANQYFMNKWQDTGKEIVGKKVWPSNLWTRAVYYEGLMALYSIDPQKNIMIMQCPGHKIIIGI